METRYFKIDPTNMTDEQKNILGRYLATNHITHLNTYTIYEINSAVTFNLVHYNLLRDESYSHDEIITIRVYSTKNTDTAGENKILGEGGYNKIKIPSGTLVVSKKTFNIDYKPYDPNTDDCLIRITHYKRAHEIRNARLNIEAIEKKYHNSQVWFPYRGQRSHTPIQKTPLYTKYVSIEKRLPGKNSYDVIIDASTQLHLHIIVNYFLVNALLTYQKQIKSAGVVHRDIKHNNILIDVTEEQINGYADIDPKMNDGMPCLNFIDTEDAILIGTETRDQFGTPGSMPPPILTNEYTVETEARDLFSLALVIMFYINGNYDVENYIREYYLYNLTSMDNPSLEGELVIKIACTATALEYSVHAFTGKIEWAELQKLEKDFPQNEVDILQNKGELLPHILTITEARHHTQHISPTDGALKMYEEMGGIFDIAIAEKKLRETMGPDFHTFCNVIFPIQNGENNFNIPAIAPLKNLIIDLLTDMMKNYYRPVEKQHDSKYYNKQARVIQIEANSLAMEYYNLSELQTYIQLDNQNQLNSSSENQDSLSDSSDHQEKSLSSTPQKLINVSFDLQESSTSSKHFDSMSTSSEDQRLPKLSTLRLPVPGKNLSGHTTPLSSPKKPAHLSPSLLKKKSPRELTQKSNPTITFERPNRDGLKTSNSEPNTPNSTRSTTPRPTTPISPTKPISPPTLVRRERGVAHSLFSIPLVPPVIEEPSDTIPMTPRGPISQSPSLLITLATISQQRTPKTSPRNQHPHPNSDQNEPSPRKNNIK